MKPLLIIIISINLLNFAVLGDNQIGKILYVLGEYPDWKWEEFGDIKTQPKYQGQVKNGKPNGYGVLTSTNGWKYFGSWKKGAIWSGTEYDNYGNIIYMWVEGKRKYHKFNVKLR